uniref:Putative capsid protein n=1 Tax=viral metagenome TaxID=1070528 RepID=A0A6M3IL62_9ZZZZ
MALLTANLTELVRVELDHVLFEDLEGLDFNALVSEIFDVTNSKKKYEFGITVAGFQLPAEKSEGASLTFREIAEGYKTTYTHKTFGMASSISMEAEMDELHNVVDRIPRAMSRSFDAMFNYYGSRIFSRATSTSEDFITGGDAVALLSASHPLKHGGTSSNTPSSAVDLNKTSFWAAVNAFYEMLDDGGKPLRNRPDRLLIPHQYEQKATELLESDKDPESAENAVNALRKRYKVRMVMWPYWIGNVDPDCWFLLSAKDQWPKGKYPLKWFWRMPGKNVKTEDYNDFFTKDYLYSGVSRFSCGYSDWRFLYGSMGA